MPLDWAKKATEQLLSKGLFQSGICLFLGAADTGKTTLIASLAKQLVRKSPIALIDADIGQSHIGPPTTIGWSLVDDQQSDFSQLQTKGISFVGDITPSGHLLQLTAGITQCVRQAAKVSHLILIDTPGFVRGPAASALWWTVQKILQPKVIVAVQRTSELADVLTGLKSLDTQIELVKVPDEIPLKSLQERQNYRQQKFREYFSNADTYKIHLSDIALQTSGYGSYADITGRLVGLRDAAGTDLVIGVALEHRQDNDILITKAPPVNIEQVRCIVIGDAAIDTGI